MKHLSLCLFVLALGCSGNSKDDQSNPNDSQDAGIQDPQDDSSTLPPPADTRPIPTDLDDEIEETPANQFQVDASSTTAAVYFKIENGALVKTAADQSWAFSVKRTAFQTNSGTSGTLGFAVADTGATDFASVTSCAATFTADSMLPASGAPGSQPYSGSSILNAWYNYDSVTHVVSSKKLVYLVSDGASCFKFQILDYASGVYKVLADVVAVPPPVQPADPQQTIDASSSTATVYVKSNAGVLAAVTSADPWEFSVKRTTWQTNSGTSGTLGFAVADTGATDYASITSCAATTFTADEMLPASGAPGSQPYSGNAILNAWYSYDSVTHVVSSKKLVYLISNGSSCYKLQIQSYAGGIYKVLADVVPIPVPPAVYTQTLDASSAAVTTYWKLDEGQLAPAAVTDSWLFAVKRTQFQTNSGTSGSGNFGVYSSNGTDFAALTSCSGLSYIYDAMLPASGAPGSQPYSGSAVLNAWYDYDFTTHVVSSKQLVYAISDGATCLKLQLLTYASGVYTVKVSQL